MTSELEEVDAENDSDRFEDSVDPRVQVELERLNAATDDINRLEVDLDEARAGFRSLLCESTARLDTVGRKLGSCVEKARPYYEARIKAKQALVETQLAAVKYERANSAHAAAKEMVYLAEEGLCTEGRTFDHAWQEMLNHATMRVNESERERTLSEAEHRRTSLTYQHAEIRVQHLQKDLKKSIIKSRPYFELKAQFNQIFEEQKCRVKELEQRVSAAKQSYAEALGNLERISDEIHRIRQYDRDPHRKRMIRSLGTSGESQVAPSTVSATTLSSSTDHWSDSGSADSESEEQYLRLPDRLGPVGSPIIPKNLQEEVHLNRSEKASLSPYTKIKQSKEPNSRTKVHPDKPLSSEPATDAGRNEAANSADSSRTTKEDENVIQSLFSKIVPSKLRQNNEPKASDDSWLATSDDAKLNRSMCQVQLESCSEASFTLSNKTSPESDKNLDKSGEVWTEVDLNEASQATEPEDAPEEGAALNNEEGAARFKLDSGLSNWISRSSVEQNTSASRRQSLDTLIMGSLATGERVKELWSQGIMKLNISSLTERRSSDPRTDKPTAGHSLSRKAPSPLDKSLLCLNADDDMPSDSESLASVEMLSDEQISCLMLDPEIREACQEVFKTTSIRETSQIHLDRDKHL
ncbi:SH3 domain-binding protein 5 isoform X2 [Nilaparvata lugens]|uniref:SH3 domain-binding protein 5 isoform X2 n=1 Tax=Nilaparvata lugens TaxID=108931 RepID=UPI00193D79D9|nr:SH3 domain-binding protein 5 isoform X2 [Nilaparvata lugens]